MLQFTEYLVVSVCHFVSVSIGNVRAVVNRTEIYRQNYVFIIATVEFAESMPLETA